MIEHQAFTTEEWSIREEELHREILPQTESIFALSNGHIGLRGNLDEGEPNGIPGTYLNSFYELRPLPYAEAGYGYPESGQTVINVTNGKIIRLLVDDEPFDIRYGQLHSHERELDMRNGVLRREVLWTSPAGKTVRVSSIRMVSFTQRSVAAISYEVEPIDGEMRVVVQSELVTNEAPSKMSKDPRTAAVLESPLVSEEHQGTGNRGILVHHTRFSNLTVGAAMDHEIEGPQEMRVDTESFPDVARVAVTAKLKPGERLRVVKYIAYGWSSERSRPAIHDQVVAALAAARLTGWNRLLEEQRAYLDDFWAHANVELDGDPEIQQAVRFALFHVLQAGARGERRPIPAKGLTGPGYDGHAFWDTEIFVLPVLNLTFPRASADALRWRHSTLDIARQHAQSLNLRGSAFAWRTIHGEECSGYWPAGTAAFHINADIAYAVVAYIEATHDFAFEAEVGVELLVETARFWCSLGYYDSTKHFRIDGVTGPDEYSALADNNVYTNLMAQHNMQAAVNVVGRHADIAQKLGVSEDEVKGWKIAADNMFIPYDDKLKVTPQAEAFTEHEVWNFANTHPDQYPLLLHFPYFDLYRKQVIKQADLVLALQLRGDYFSDEQKARDFAYYEPLTVRDSSLSANTQAVIAAEVGQLELAYEYLREAARMDLDDLEHNAQDGVHIASLAGAWTALVGGFGGMRAFNEELTFAPRLPSKLTRLAFHILYRGQRLRVEVTKEKATYRLLDGDPLKIKHYGQDFTVSIDDAITQDIPAIHAGPRPTQPPGREPIVDKSQRP
jgi:alpha,alpha-trehalose phosphorylase